MASGSLWLLPVLVLQQGERLPGTGLSIVKGGIEGLYKGDIRARQGSGFRDLGLRIQDLGFRMRRNYSASK